VLVSLLARLHLEEPQNDVAVALAGSTCVAEPVRNALIKPNHPLALLVGLRLVGVEPNGSVATTASKAAEVMAMRII
jgi:hypothetical protein